MTEITLMLLALAALVAVTDWRKGMVLCVLTGILQDPARKLIPEQPVYFIVLVGVVFGATWLGALLKNVGLKPGVIQGWRENMGLPFGSFVALVLAQALHSSVNYGNPMVTGIGLMVWLAPIPAVVLAYQFALRGSLPGLRRWMVFYCACAMLSLTGVYLQYVGFEWDVLGEVGEGLTIYDLGGVLKAYSGFYRSSEIAAWHTGTTACFVFMLFSGKRLTAARLLLALLIVAVLLSLGVLTGRRKMLVEVAVFFSVYACLWAWFQRGAARLALAAIVAGLIAYVAVVGMVAPDGNGQPSSARQYQLDPDQQYKGYAVRGQTVFEDIPARFMELGVAPVTWAINNFGVLGAGVGTGSQGIGEAAAGIDRGAAEGGLGKITMELGLPGLLVAGWLLLAMIRFFRKLLAITARTSLPHARMAFGFVALLAAKVASFSVATQAYSDLFILLLMGWVAGFFFAMPVLAARNQRARTPATDWLPTTPAGLAQGRSA